MLKTSIDQGFPNARSLFGSSLNDFGTREATETASKPGPNANEFSRDGYRGRFKYDHATARQYQNVNERKHHAEMRMLDRVFAHIPPNQKVLDTPCGGGRMSAHLALKGYTLHAADLSDAMIEIARENLGAHRIECPVSKQDIERLEFTDGQFDTTVCFRLFHHFPNPSIRRRAVDELCRVSRQYVALSYFSPISVTSVKRKLRVAFAGKRSEKHSTPLREVEQYFAQCGFRLVRDVAQLPLLHTMHVALFERIR